MSELTDRLDAIEARLVVAAPGAITITPSDVSYLLTLARKQQDALDSAAELIRDLTDPDECSFDHHGGCQAHGYLSLQPGETCPQHDAKEWGK